MISLGIRKSRYNSGYKSEDQPTDRDQKMSRTSNFNFELVKSNDSAQPGDKFYAAREVEIRQESQLEILQFKSDLEDLEADQQVRLVTEFSNGLIHLINSISHAI